MKNSSARNRPDLRFRALLRKTLRPGRGTEDGKYKTEDGRQGDTEAGRRGAGEISLSTVIASEP